MKGVVYQKAENEEQIRFEILPQRHAQGLMVMHREGMLRDERVRASISGEVRLVYR